MKKQYELGQRLLHYYTFYAKVFGTWIECGWSHFYSEQKDVFNFTKKIQLLF